jgi:2-polyprenyl-3-methyl-5-hydroxy-6-metoxy-1,4-benzoquinol methylase
MPKSTASTPQFILPVRAVIERVAGGGPSYAIYNYYGNGPIASAKRKRFQRALALGATANADRAIDMGCADGLLLPSLSKHYKQVVAIDVHEEAVARSKRLAESLALDNVRVLCGAATPFDALREAIGPGYGVMYLLETLEHVGEQPDIWGTKVSFLHDCFSLLGPDGRIVISVPKMVGMIMLFKNALQRSLRLGHDQLTWKQLLRSAILKNTDDLEPLWDGHHVGFNHLKLDEHLRRSFIVHHRSESAISVFYVLGRRASGAGV